MPDLARTLADLTAEVAALDAPDVRAFVDGVHAAASRTAGGEVATHEAAAVVLARLATRRLVRY